MDPLRSARVRAAKQIAEERARLFVRVCPEMKIPAPVREHRFSELRGWLFDFAWPEQKVALESEGGAYIGGAHTRGKHFEADCEKYSEANIDGWCVIRVLSHRICALETFDKVRRGLARKR